MTEIHPAVQESIMKSRENPRNENGCGVLPKFTEGDLVLVIQSNFNASEKLAIRWRGPRCIKKAVTDYIYHVEDLQNGTLYDIHA